MTSNSTVSKECKEDEERTPSKTVDVTFDVQNEQMQDILRGFNHTGVTDELRNNVSRFIKNNIEEAVQVHQLNAIMLRVLALVFLIYEEDCDEEEIKPWYTRLDDCLLNVIMKQADKYDKYVSQNENNSENEIQNDSQNNLLFNIDENESEND